MKIIEKCSDMAKKPIGQLIKSSLFFVLSLGMLAIAVVAYAWFAENTNSKAESIAIMVDASSMLTADFKAYIVGDIDLYTNDAFASQSNSGSNVDAYGITTITPQNGSLAIEAIGYDTVFTEFNTYSSVVVEIDIMNIISQSGTIDIKLYRNESIVMDTNDLIYDYASNLFSFNLFLNSSLTSSSTTRDIYSAITSAYDSSSADDMFIKDATTNARITGESTYTLASLLNLSVHYQLSDLTVGSNGLYQLKAYLCFGYDEVAAGIFATQNGLEIDTTTRDISNRYPISNDLTAIKLSLLPDQQS